MKAISLDASTTHIGWSIWEDDTLLAYGKLSPSIAKLEWRERIQNMIPQVQELINEHKPKSAIVEDVPLMDGKGKMTLVQLGSTQGSLLGVFGANNIPLTFKHVASWRKDIGLHDGTREGTQRENLKPNSIKMANELFGLDLVCTYTKGGNYNEPKSDDDISDSILLYASTRDKYKVTPKQLTRKFKI